MQVGTNIKSTSSHSGTLSSDADWYHQCIAGTTQAFYCSGHTFMNFIERRHGDKDCSLHFHLPYGDRTYMEHGRLSLSPYYGVGTIIPLRK